MVAADNIGYRKQIDSLDDLSPLPFSLRGLPLIEAGDGIVVVVVVVVVVARRMTKLGRTRAR